MPMPKSRQRGQVKNLGGGKFKIAVPLGTKPDGTRPYHNETLRSSTEPKAWKRVNALLVLVDSGQYFTASNQTISELMAEWKERLRRRGLKLSSLDTYDSVVESYINPMLGEIPLSNFSLDTAQRFYDGLQDRGFKSSFIHKIHLRFKPALAYAKVRERIETNPLELVELPPMNKPKKARVFDEREALAFIEAARQVAEDIVFIFVLLTGLRPSEFFGVSYPDLSLARHNGTERGCVRVWRIICFKRGGGWYFGTPKTESSARSIYFPASLYRELMDRQEAHLEKLRKLGQRHELVFTNYSGNPLGRCVAYKRFLKVCLRAGLSTEGRSLYTLRRSHATISALAGESDKSLSERLGHASVRFTQDEYVDVLPEMAQIAADKLENRLFRPQVADGDDGPVM